jgi:hypothetical protein
MENWKAIAGSSGAKRLTLLIPILLLSLALVACEGSVSVGGDSISKSEVEDTASAALAKQVGQTPASFICPSDLDAEVGASETCTLTDDTGAEYDATVTVTSVSEDGSDAKYDVQVADQPNREE